MINWKKIFTKSFVISVAASVVLALMAMVYDEGVGARYFYFVLVVLVFFAANFVPWVFFLRPVDGNSNNEDIKYVALGKAAEQKYTKFEKEFSLRVAKMLQGEVRKQRGKSFWAYMDFMSKTVFIIWALFFGFFSILIIGGSIWGKWYGPMEFVGTLGIIAVGGMLVLKLLYYEALGFKRVADKILDGRLMK